MLGKKDKVEDKRDNTASIKRIIFTIVTSAILLQGTLWLLDSIYLFRSDIEEISQIQTDYIKAELKERVASVIDYSDYRSQETEAVLREELVSWTYEAHALMTRVYENNKDEKSEDEIAAIIKDALRDIRFNNGRGYFFVDTLEGDVILYPVYPENEGMNLIDLQDEKGNYVMQEEIHLVKNQGEGFIEGYWKIPDAEDDKAHKKITFVKAFEPYGWYVGCGDYLDEITKEIQQEVLAYVDSIQYGEDDSQYVFLHDYKGVELANGVYPEMVGKNNYELEDIRGAKVYQEQIQICIEEKGGYLTHYWPTVDGEGYYKKMTYVAPLEKWQWIIGTGVDVTDLDEMILAKQKELNKFIWQRVLVILLVLAILIAVSMLHINRFTRKLKKNFSIFRDYMISAKDKLTPIEVDHLDYADFSDLAEVTNAMTEEINRLLHYDELTGLYNRRCFRDHFEKAMEIAPEETGVILMDIDRFKRINDNFGHKVGDETLMIVASLIKDTVSNIGAAGRFGGEEFIVVMPKASLDETVAMAEEIRGVVGNYYIEAIDGHVTISTGVAHSNHWQKSELFKQADKKLYLAKETGRNKTEF